MSVTSERIRASRISDNVGAALIFLGAAGFIAAVVLAGWIIHDLDNAKGSFEIGTVTKLESVAVVGLTPALLSLLVIAFGVYLQTRSTDLLLGIAVDSDLFSDDEDEDEELQEPS